MTFNIQAPKITLNQEVIDFLNQKLRMLARRYHEVYCDFLQVKIQAIPEGN